MRLQHRCFPVAKVLRKFILKNSSELTLGSDCFELFFWTVAFKTIHPVAFKHNLEQMPSLYLTSTLSFEPRFVSYVHQQRLIYKKQTLLVLGLLVLLLLLLCRNFSGISGNLEKKNILQIIEQLIQFSYLLL